MSCGAVLKQKREARDLTQPRLAAAIGVTEGTLRKYELQLTRIPHDVANLAAHALNAPEIALAICEGCPCNWWSLANILGDTHQSAEVLAVIQEAGEAIQAVQAMVAGRAAAVRREAVERACDQVLDLVPLAAAAVASWCRAYGIDMRAISRRHRAKLVNRGYISDGEMVA